ncbi:MAG: histidinol dehydrogenase [Anaerolineae bacterium SG8_19]|nr:MAG: histidinol dehydrogenase [Anaerolineae bacterium SG8_19]
MIQIYDVYTARQSILQRASGPDKFYSTAVAEMVEKVFGSGVTPSQAVTEIVESVRKNGEIALQQWSKKLDQVTLNDFRVSPKEMLNAYDSLTAQEKKALKDARDRIRVFHELQPMPEWQTTALGGVLGQRVTPIDRVGIYVPGGTAPLPSSLLMSVIPAQVAGVGQCIICTPPSPHPSILAVAHLCSPVELYQVGGAQAIAAMAYGTATIPKVDKIVGAGNLFVTLAKQQLFGVVGIDALAGPTETMIIADSTANPKWVAADLLAQAEHDVMASAILLTPDLELAKEVQVEVARQLEDLSRANIIARSLRDCGGIVLTSGIDEAIILANDYAAEHLCLEVSNPQSVADKITNAGGIFIGDRSFEVLGDYVAGPSHVMPTGGSARFSSPLNVLDFVKITSIIALDSQTSMEIGQSAAEIADMETLTAHASAARIRQGENCV